MVLSSLDNSKIKKIDFNDIIKNGKKVFNDDFKFFFTKNNYGYLRYGISVSKKNFKLAVERNKIKRQVRSYFLKYLNLSLDIVVIIKSNFISKKYWENKKSFNKLIAITINGANK